MSKASTVDELKAHRDRLRAKFIQKASTPFTPSVNHLSTPTQKLYTNLKIQWEAFLGELQEPDSAPDVGTLSMFMYWYAKKTKGRIVKGGRATSTTILWVASRFRKMYKQFFGILIAEETIDSVLNYIQTDLIEELGIQDAEYEKAYTDWEDTKLVIRYIIECDKHRWSFERQRLQLVWLFLLVADNGERLGAIISSGSYRKEEVALFYKDVQLILMSSSSVTNAPKFKLRITFHNRKGCRKSAKKFLVQTYFQRSQHVYCEVLWFLAFAFLDNAFEDYSTPLALFSKTNTTGCDEIIRIKQSKLSMPILRRTEGLFSNVRFSTTLPLQDNFATSQAQRIFREMGFKERFTFYCLRRVVGNVIADMNVPEGRRKQLMGHYNTSDKTFQKYYQSRTYTVDTGNMVRKEAIRKEKAEELCMRLRRDPIDAPPILYTATLVNALYPQDGIERSAVVILDSILLHCRETRLERIKNPLPIPRAKPRSQQDLKDHAFRYLTAACEAGAYKRDLDIKDGLCKAVPRPAILSNERLVKYTIGDNILLLNLRIFTTLSWEGIAAYFPGRSLGALRTHYAKIRGRLLELKFMPRGPIDLEILPLHVGSKRKRQTALTSDESLSDEGYKRKRKC
ncbi:hypothetical protein BGZ60DRAFT_523134 [Tricladium varicosporioides]|nr:hypothetical protein BGZ60DRAFT_523134 [Hymenoscyphus varicosporioides]